MVSSLLGNHRKSTAWLNEYLLSLFQSHVKPITQKPTKIAILKPYQRGKYDGIK